MELIFIRHAQPEWVRDGINLIDPPLTDLGRKQAERLGESAKTWKQRPTAIVASAARRTRETAEPICAAFGMQPEVVPWFVEIGLPASWEGAPAEIVERYFQTARDRTVDEWWLGIPGGESFHDFWDRITTNLVRYLGTKGATRPSPAAHPSAWEVANDEERILFIGHGGSNSAAISFLLGIDPVPWPWERFVSQHASVSRLRTARLLKGRIFGLRAMSDVGHLTPDMVTR